MLLSPSGLRLTLIASCVDDDHRLGFAEAFEEDRRFDNEAARSLFRGLPIGKGALAVR